MRIVYVLTSLGMGGAERQVLALGERMAARGHTVSLLILRPPLAEEWPTRLGVFHLDMRRNPLAVLRAVARGRRFLAQLQPQIVHSHGFHGNIMARLFHALAIATAPISTIHNVYEGGHARMLSYRMTDPLSRITTAVSAVAAERFIKARAMPASKSIVLTNGIDSTEFAPSQERRDRIRFDMQVTGEFVWLAAGRIVPAKNYPNLLRAFANVHAAFPSAQLWIAGEGSDAESPRLRELATELGLGDQLRWLGLRRDLPALLDAADAFVLSSAWEGMPLAAGEAMSMEKPVVATDVGGLRELIGDAGILVPPSDAAALADAMISLMNLPEENRLALGRSARERIVSNFDIDARAAEWEILYQRILDSNI